MRERRAIEIGGTVQGVGFRPFVHGLASRFRLGGWVKNASGAVLIEVEGEPASLDSFLQQLVNRPPPLAQIDSVRRRSVPVAGEHRFRIERSGTDRAGRVFLSPDVATCSECLAELFDPSDRRYRYPFLNCTNCGPRLTIVTGAPYDRERTTMASFALCPACRCEYDDPRDRRFHAQPTACPECGPQLELFDRSGTPIVAARPLSDFAKALRDGRVGALKGLGGYHLVCDARNGEAVGELRRRKHRDEKPFAVMVRDVQAGEAICALGPRERELLLSPQCPIVLSRKRREQRSSRPRGTPRSLDGGGPEDGGSIAELVAPGNPCLGVMLPYTPLHHLLLREVDGLPLVMTSGNRSDEPIAYRDEDAVDRLSGIADVFLVHNRPIHVRCDDSVTRVVDGEDLPVRRSRGYAPQPVRLPEKCACPILAVGGQLKGTFALGHGSLAFLSHHLGDLDHYQAYRAFEKDIELYQDLFDIRPECLVHDLHPDYASTRYAADRASRDGLQTLAVQHHHAHMAGCMAEHQLTGPVIGVSFDGTGYGTDGAVWGGEFLLGDYRQFRRVAHLRYVGMPGGERAIREPWRMAAAHLLDAGLSPYRLTGNRTGTASPAANSVRIVERMLERGLNTPTTSSAGRLFDAVAAIVGLRDRVSYEGQAAMEWEWLADEIEPEGGYPFELIEERGGRIEDEGSWSPFVGGQSSILGPPVSITVDTRPLIRAVADDVGRVDAARIARRFHSTMVDMIARTCRRVAESVGIRSVVLSGGVFINALLTAEVVARLSGEGFQVYRHHVVPPNDGGLSLGQLAVAVARLGRQAAQPDNHNSRRANHESDGAHEWRKSNGEHRPLRNCDETTRGEKVPNGRPEIAPDVSPGARGADPR